MSKKVLFVAYHFPPDAAVGALRVQKFVKYLPKYGWQPFVLTVKEKYYPVKDFKRMEDANGIVVERTAFWRTPLQLVIDIRDKYIRKNNVQAEQMDQSISQSKPEKPGQKPYLKRLLAGLNWLPDDRLYWFIPGMVKGIRLIKRNHIQHIVVSAPPHSSLILAYLLTLLTGAKLIVDWRDPWCLSGYQSHVNTFKPSVLLKIEKKIQNLILKKTSTILTTNETFRTALLEDNCFLSSDRVHVVYNGFDSNDFPESGESVNEPSKKFIVSYLGTFYLDRTPSLFLKALSSFIQEKGHKDHELEVRLIGDVKQAEGESVTQLIEDVNLGGFVKLVGRVEYSEALKFMKESNLLLLLAPNQPFQVPAKTYEYMATGNPILAVSGPGATSSLIEEFHCGIAVDPQDMHGMVSALHMLYDDYLNDGQNYSCDARLFERRNQTERLAAILQQVQDSI